VQHDGRRLLTPLALVLIMIEVTDVLFAVDSIPAIFGITRDPFVVYTSNVCAILGLRSLYFLLAGIVHKFVYLRSAMAIILSFIGSKMLLADVYHIPTTASLVPNCINQRKNASSLAGGLRVWSTRKGLRSDSSGR